ncbi:MAG: DNA polymerase III subunit epsilon [Rickettsiales bacterium]|jgi:DNA polymerase-3 subunit epsilon|nr:DNA polymerase III subunit epsilon [Rickettsiales bacterium]
MTAVREICLDTETTGLYPNEGDKLIEIGCVELIDGKKTKNYFHQLINPEREVPEEVVRIHGITTEKLVDKPKFFEIADSLLNFFQDSVLVAHNASFDVKFLNFELESIGYRKISNEVIDSLLLAKSKYPGQKNSLDNLCKRYSIDNSKRTFHGALLDAELLADVYVELNGGTQKSFLDGQDSAVNSGFIGIDRLMARIGDNKILPSRNFAIDEEDLKKHNEFLEKYIKNSIWFESREV